MSLPLNGIKVVIAMMGLLLVVSIADSLRSN
jgi:hypothetical protein